MRKYVAKFGGSSLADAGQFKKVADIIKADPCRKYIVASAPGKRFGDDIKVTDMLYSCYEQARSGNSFEGESVGRLPEFCAALNRNFLNVALLVAEAVRTGKRHAVVQALAVDPITCANGLSIGEIRKLEQQMYDANAPFLEYLK